MQDVTPDITADWRNMQGQSAMEEDPGRNISIDD
jgi:hypothetical protein